MQDESALRQAMQAAASPDTVAQLAGTLGNQSCGDALLPLTGQKVGRMTGTKPVPTAETS